jgi:hypothetical protein
MRANLLLNNRTNKLLFFEVLGLSHSKNDNALLHDVFNDEQCRQALYDSKHNNDPGGELNIGYSNSEIFTILGIKSGNSLQFSVPIDHMSGGKCIRVRYWIGDSTQPKSRDEYHYIWIGRSP